MTKNYRTREELQAEITRLRAVAEAAQWYVEVTETDHYLISAMWDEQAYTKGGTEEEQTARYQWLANRHYEFGLCVEGEDADNPESPYNCLVAAVRALEAND